MPVIGGVYLPDAAMPELPVHRPGFGEILSSAAEGAWDQLRYGLPLGVEKLSGTLTPADEAFYRSGLRRGQEASNRAPPASLDDALALKVNPLRFAAENLVASAPYSVGALAGGIGGGLLGAGAGGPPGAAAGFLGGAAAVGAPQFFASNIDRAQQQEPLTREAAIRSAVAAPFQAASDAVVERFLPGAGKFAGPLAASVSRSLKRGFVGRTAVSMLEAGATEAVSEAGQQLAERWSAGLPVADSEAMREYVTAGATAFAAGGLLGAGGGIRTRSDTTPPGSLSNEDIGRDIDSKLSSPPPVAGGRAEEQLGLPLQGGQALEQQLALTGEASAPEAPLLPSQLPQLSLDQALSTVPEDTQLELGQRFRDNVTPADLPLPGGAQVGPELEAQLRGEAPQVPIPEVLAKPLPAFNPPAEAPPAVDVTAVSRPFRDAPVEDLHKVMSLIDKGEEVHPDVARFAVRELQARQDELAGVVEVAQERFQTLLDDAKKGLRGGWVQGLQADNPQDLVAKAVKYAEDNNASLKANEVKFLQRIGVLDDNQDPGSAMLQYIAAQQTAAQQIEIQPAEGVSVPAVAAASAVEAPVATTPADHTWITTQWPKLAPQRQDDSIKALRPVSQIDLENKVYEAHGAADVTPQMEKLGQTLGLYNGDKELTPQGRKVALRQTEFAPEIAAAAQGLGYAGDAAASFSQGVSSVLESKPVTTFTGFGDLAAHTAGQVWAEQQVKGAGSQQELVVPRTAGKVATQQILERYMPQEGTRDNVVRTVAITPEQTRKAALNRLVSAANLGAVRDSEVSTLRKMIDQGASEQEVEAALQNAAEGKLTFRDTARSISTFEPFQPTAAERARIRQMRGAASEAQVARRLEQAAARSKPEQRMESAVAQRTFELRNLVKFALAEGGINAKQAEKLSGQLERGQVAQVSEALKSYEAEMSSMFAGADPQFERAVDGKSLEQVLDYMAGNAPTPFHAALMSRIRDMSRKLQALGITMDFRVVHPGDQVPVSLNRPGTRGLTRLTRNPPHIGVWINAADRGSMFAGADYSTAAHELTHAATMALTVAANDKRFANTQAGKAVKDLFDLSNTIIQHFNRRVQEGNLSAFEQRVYDRLDNALTNPHEIISWGMTNPEMQRWLASVPYDVRDKTSLFDRFVDLVRRALGLSAANNTALAEVIRVTDQLLTTPQAELEHILVADDPNGTDLEAAMQSGAGGNRTVDGADTTVQGLIGQVAGAVDKIPVEDIKGSFRRTVLGWMSLPQIVRTAERVFPELAKVLDAHRERAALRAKLDLITSQLYQRYEKLENEDKNSAKWTGELMQYTQFGINPELDWAAHPQLHKEPNAKALEQLVGEANDTVNKLKRKGHFELYQEFHALNQMSNFARMSGTLYRLVVASPELAAGLGQSIGHPGDAFMARGGFVSVGDMTSWWRTTLDNQTGAITDYIKQQRGTIINVKSAAARTLNAQLSPIEMQLKEVAEARARMARAPYFHLGRFGDHFVSFAVTKTNGAVDRAALAKVAKAVDSLSGVDATISTDSTQPNVYIRLGTIEQREKLAALAQQLEKQGAVEKDTIKAGPRQQDTNYGYQEGVTKGVNRIIASIEASPAFDSEGMAPAEKEQMAQLKQSAIDMLRDAWLEHQTDTSLAKVLTQRDNIQGFSSDMIRSYMWRQRVGSIAMANMLSQPKFDTAYIAIKSRVKQSVGRAAPKEAAAAGVQPSPDWLADYAHEVQLREARNPIRNDADTYDRLRATAHNYFLALSPAYYLVNMSAIATTLWPELSKKYRYAQSAAAIRRAGGHALTIAREVMKEFGAVGVRNMADVAVTDEIIDRAKVPEEVKAFTKRMIARGFIDIGSQGRELARTQGADVGGKYDKALRWSSSLGMMSETVARLTAALAARDLHGGVGQEVEEYAGRVVGNSMFEFSNWAVARKLGKTGGFAGPITPVVTQFMQWNIQLMEKLYSEGLDAFSRARPGESVEAGKQRRIEARRYLMAHMTAVTALAGSLGLPFASVMAAVIERMVDSAGDDDEPYDATASWRNFLSDTFGADVGEVLARGLPRAVGVDVSTRIGEADILPFSKMLGDRRAWKDSIGDTLARGMGASPSMLLNVASGFSRIADGDTLGGLKEIVPVALKNPIETYRMTTQGYVDGRGNKLPLSPVASAYLWQLMGFSPAAKAEYSEARGDQIVRKMVLSQDAKVLRDSIVRQLQTGGDRDKARELIRQAIQFDQANPTYAVIPGVERALERGVRERATASTLQAPIGVSMKDIAGRRLTRYVNADYVQ